MYYLINQCVASHNDVNAFSLLSPGMVEREEQNYLRLCVPWSSTLSAVNDESSCWLPFGKEKISAVGRQRYIKV